MGITSALYTGISGLKTLGSALQVTGNNIANVNTTGYKATRAEFSDLLSQTINLGGRQSQVGRGVQLDGITRGFGQGSFQNTDRITDMAISGNGFFILSDEAGVETQYTRAGNFFTDDEGYLVNPSKLRVQGLVYDISGQSTGALGPINLSNLSSPANVTSEVTVHANLNSEEDAMTFDPNDPGATSNFSTTVTIHDSLGSAHTMTVYFNKTGDNQWDFHARVDPNDVVDPAQNIVSGSLDFTEDGWLNDVQLSDPAWPGFDFTGGAAPGQIIDFNFGDPIAAGGTGFAGTRQFAGANLVNFQTQDGFKSGNLQSFVVEPDGVITGIFSNGRTRPVAQVMLANFENPAGLSAQGSNMFSETPHSGQATIATPNTGAAGEVVGNTLELSNVDLSNEFVSMITNQRGFQANSRVVNIGDEMLQEIVNLAR